MSRRRAIYIAIFLCLCMGTIYSSATWYQQREVERTLTFARQHLRAVFTAQTAQERESHGGLCTAAAATISAEEGGAGSTATLFVIGLVPITGLPTDLQVPPASAVEKIPTEDLLLISRLLFNTRKFGPADQLLDVILSRDDGFEKESLQLACTIRADLGRDEEVLSYCNRLIALDASDPQPYRVKATIFRSHSSWDHYVEAIEKAYERTQPRDPVLQVELIDGYIHIGKNEAARQKFDELASTHEEFIQRVPTMHARLLIQEGKDVAARKLLSDYIAATPTDVEALTLQGKLLVSALEFDEGIQTLKAALELEPSSEEVCFQIGQAYARMDEKEQAATYLEKHRKLLDSKIRLSHLEQQAANEPDNISVRRELAELYSTLELDELAAFWTRAAIAAEGK